MGGGQVWKWIPTNDLPNQNENWINNRTKALESNNWQGGAIHETCFVEMLLLM